MFNQRARLDFTLTIGSKSDSITVFGQRAAAQHFARLSEHLRRQPVCGERALKRVEL